jgi:hypothetical protein
MAPRDLPQRRNLMFAVAVRDDTNLWLALRIHRGRDGSVYVMWPRDSDWDPHTTYHASGSYWQRTSGEKLQPSQRQKLDSSFRGSEMVVSTGVTLSGVRATGVVCDPENFDQVFEISATDLPSPPRVCLSVHVSETEVVSAPLSGSIPGQVVRKQSTYGDGIPWLVFTFW